ncbi:ornithine aminomutase subunit alpha [Vallitalea guaymasensis]|uniref:Ornithine aminomutase subunit alpha n=1 Tax=Vallitalea guaymasensis TaxID=1185412 RepID=A0A8J8MDJ6_9FIRM|nr:ornithine aminomutase subunit alpha [Vallitalea guaymasensis]QUH30903.1 ornithine aminomutase subunit alpha [Vallitalea guaymasensis]
MGNNRLDDYESRRKHLENLTEDQLEQRFWELAEKIVDPMIEMAKNNTSPSIERSVLLRMGFSSIESKAIVTSLMEKKKHLVGKGAGHLVYRAARDKDLSIREAGLRLANNDEELWAHLEQVFGGGK